MIGISHVQKPGCHDARQRFLTKRYRPGSDPGKEFFKICCIATGHHGHAGNTRMLRTQIVCKHDTAQQKERAYRAQRPCKKRRRHAVVRA